MNGEEQEEYERRRMHDRPGAPPPRADDMAQIRAAKRAVEEAQGATPVGRFMPAPMSMDQGDAILGQIAAMREQLRTTNRLLSELHATMRLQATQGHDMCNKLHDVVAALTEMVQRERGR